MNAKFQRRVQRYGWDKAADLYENSWQEQLEPAQTKLLDMANLQQGETVLDTACGTGLVTFRAADLVASNGEVMGTDISDGMLEMATQAADRSNFSNTKFSRMDGEDLQLPENSYDAALCAMGILYYPDPLTGLKELYRVVKPGGRAVAAVWGERKNCGWAGVFQIVDNQVASEVCPLFFQLGGEKMLTKNFKEAGFSNVEEARLTTLLHYETDEAACAAAFAGGPVALAYAKFTERVRNQVHSEYLESIRNCRNGNGYNIPGEFVIVKGKKT